ncbi:MAG TPA: hypothetical protein VK752_32170 [Bryobacteraceae bacterium]|nr:hypothetical protein [Bryobacteraceae bacterium]
MPDVSVGSTGANLTFSITSASTGGWLSAETSNFPPSTSGTTPDQIAIQINSASLATGSYTGTITLTPNGGGTAAVINVSLTVSGSGTTTSPLAASPSQLTFGYELHQTAPPSQTSLITSGGIPLPIGFSINDGNTSANQCPQGWLQATLSSTTTPANLTISIVTQGLGPGTCAGNITLTSNTSTNGTTTTLVGVTLFVSSSALLNVSIPTGLQTLTLQQGGRPVQFALGLTSSDSTSQLSFSLTASSSNGWLSLSPNSGTTPASIDVQITPGTVLAVGNYTGSIQINSPGLLNNSTTIPVNLTITSASSVSVTPAGSQAFTELQGGSLPSPITLTLNGAPAQASTFTTSVIEQSGGNWLQVSPQSGAMTATPTSSSATLTLGVAANSLTQGVYTAEAVITFQNSSIPQIIIPVSLTVGPPAAAITATPSSISFSYQAGGTVPAAQSISISNPASGSIPYTVASISDSWFSVAPSSGNTPGTLLISVTPQSLQPGSYTGSFTLTSPNVATAIVSVALFISASTTPQPFIISNAASGVGSQLSPGEIITIKGSGLGPGVPVSFAVNSLTNPTLGGVEVTFNNFPGTLLYVSSTQINVTVPYEIAGSAAAAIVVSYQGAQSAPITQPVAPASLGLFTNNSAGSGQAAVLNPNSSCAQAPCYNTANTPVSEGSYISVYGTGGGQTIPASTDGEVTPGLATLVFEQYVSATIGGKAAPILFAGAAPGAVTGLVQFNIQVPTGVSGSALPIVVTISGPTSSQSQAGATVAVQ